LERTRAQLQAIKKINDVKLNGRAICEEYTITPFGAAQAVEVDKWECPDVPDEPVQNDNNAENFPEDNEEFKARHDAWKANNFRFIRERDAWIEVNKEATALIQAVMSEAAELRIGANFLDAPDLWAKYLSFYDIAAYQTARTTEVKKNAYTKMKETDMFMSYCSWVMPYICEHYNCEEEDIHVRDQLLSNCASVRRLVEQVEHCKLGDYNTAQTMNLLATADIRNHSSGTHGNKSIAGLMNDDQESTSLGISAFVRDLIKCWNCDKKHLGDCTLPCRYCGTFGDKKKRASLTHELMDCISYRIAIGKKKTVPSYSITPKSSKRKPEDDKNKGNKKSKNGKDKKDEQEEED
jgi:hypothetical protein